MRRKLGVLQPLFTQFNFGVTDPVPFSTTDLLGLQENLGDAHPPFASGCARKSAV